MTSRSISEPYTSSQQYDTYVTSRDDEAGGYASQFLIPRKPCLAPSAVPGAPHLHQENGKAEKRPRRRLVIFQVWWLEIACCLTSVAALVAIVATVYSFRGRQPPEWRFHSNLNTLVAIYVVVMKAAMLLVVTQGLSQLKWRWFEQQRTLGDLASFDSASRGPLGSIFLIWKLRAKHLIASCGALITLAALIVDPFAQQVISAKECTFIIPHTATIAKTNYYIGGLAGEDRSLAIGLSMQNSINAGIYDPGTPVTFDCPTGNCTFRDPYYSVGYCSECSDVTYNVSVEKIQTHQYNTVTEQLYMAYNITLAPASADAPTTFSFLNGSNSEPEISTVLDMNTYEYYTDILLGLTGYKVNSTPCTDGCSLFDTCEGNLTWGCGALWSPGAGNAPIFDNSSAGIGAARCILKPCVRAYTAIVTDGRLYETSTPASTPIDWADDTLTVVDTNCLSASDRTSLTNAGYILPDDGFLVYNITYEGNGSYYDYNNVQQGPHIPGAVNNSCIYEPESFQSEFLGHYLSTYLVGNLSLDEGCAGPDCDGVFGAPVLLAIYQDGNVTFDNINSTFEGIANAITQNMHENGAAGYTDHAVGNTLHTGICVNVQWGFLAYPTTLVLAVIAFLFVTILETHRTEGNDWKSLPLPLLFHGFDEETVDSIDNSDLTRIGDMSNIAGGIAVRMEHSERGWNLDYIPFHGPNCFYHGITVVVPSKSNNPGAVIGGVTM